MDDKLYIPPVVDQKIFGEFQRIAKERSAKN